MLVEKKAKKIGDKRQFAIKNREIAPLNKNNRNNLSGGKGK